MSTELKKWMVRVHLSVDAETVPTSAVSSSVVSSSVVSAHPYSPLYRVITQCAQKHLRRVDGKETANAAHPPLRSGSVLLDVDLSFLRHGFALSCLMQFRVTDTNVQLRQLPLLPSPEELGVVDINTSRFIEEPTAAEAAADAAICGMILIRRHGKKHFSKRFVAINSCRLIIYKSNKDQKPKVAPLFIGFFRVREENCDEEISQFSLCHPVSGTFTFRAESAEEGNIWIQKLRGAVFNFTRMIIAIFMRRIEEIGIEHEGLFRVSGSITVVQEAINSIEKGILFQATSLAGAGEATGLFKAILRSMAEPLFPFQMYPKLMDIGLSLQTFDFSDENPDLSSLRGIISELDPQMKALLAHLCHFFHRVLRHKESNRMSIQSLATVFAPNLLRPLNDYDVSTLLRDAKLCELVLKVIITYYHLLLPEEYDTCVKFDEILSFPTPEEELEQQREYEQLRMSSIPENNDHNHNHSHHHHHHHHQSSNFLNKSIQMASENLDFLQSRLARAIQGSLNTGNSPFLEENENCCLESSEEINAKLELSNARAVRLALETRVSELTLRIAELEIENSKLATQVTSGLRENTANNSRDAQLSLMKIEKEKIDAEKEFLKGEKNRLETQKQFVNEEREELQLQWIKLEQERAAFMELTRKARSAPSPISEAAEIQNSNIHNSSISADSEQKTVPSRTNSIDNRPDNRAISADNRPESRTSSMDQDSAVSSVRAIRMKFEQKFQNA